MSGLIKAKKYDWKDSNMALFGSDTEKQVKKESAEAEEAWQGAGQEVGLQIWRIVKFKVTNWPKEDYGEFFNGDSYIILNTYTEEGGDELLYDVHFWIGKHSSQDEYGTAAYKTVELDTFLDDKPVQHREVEGHESTLFKSYFDKLIIMNGGADTGFRRVVPEEYGKRLLHFHGDKKKVTIKEVPFSRKSLKSDDVFILDLGLKVYIWVGSTANKDEKFRASQYVQQLKSERNGKPEVEVFDEEEVSEDHEFMQALPDDDVEDEEEAEGDRPKSLHCLSDSSGNMEFTCVGEGDDVQPDKLDSNEVFILDSDGSVYVWVGKGASIDERRNAMAYAHTYSSKMNTMAPITIVAEGKRTQQFDTAITA